MLQLHLLKQGPTSSRSRLERIYLTLTLLDTVGSSEVEHWQQIMLTANHQRENKHLRFIKDNEDSSKQVILRIIPASQKWVAWWNYTKLGFLGNELFAIPMASNSLFSLVNVFNDNDVDSYENDDDDDDENDNDDDDEENDNDDDDDDSNKNRPTAFNKCTMKLPKKYLEPEFQLERRKIADERRQRRQRRRRKKPLFETSSDNFCSKAEEDENYFPAQIPIFLEEKEK